MQLSLFPKQQYTTEETSALIAAIKTECDRLGWTEYKSQRWLMENYGRRSRWLLPDDLLKPCLDSLRDL